MESSVALRSEWRNSRWICIGETGKIVSKLLAPLGQERQKTGQSGNGLVDIRGTEKEPQIGMCQSSEGPPRL
jgi:hypothetical protein